MKLLKIKLFVTKHKNFFTVVLVISVICGSAFGMLQLDVDKIVGNPTLFGVIGTLLGALIGGVFSLIGSIWVNLKQQQALQNLKRKNEIYDPLYDELVNIQRNILQQNPYPNYISFKKDTQTILPHPQFAEWKCIKADTRYLGTPDVLIKQMDQLEKAIYSYLSVRQKANEEIQIILNDVLIENNLSRCNIKNIGSVISGNILSYKKIDIYKAIEIGDPKNIDEPVREKINDEVYYKCDNSRTIIEVRKKYEEWLNLQERTIEMLTILIKQVLVQYKG